MNKGLVRIDYSRQFIKQLKKAPREIQIAFKNRRILFNQDEFHPQLRNHSLSGKLKEYRSINITGDWRAIFSQTSGKSIRVITFHTLGTHSQLYK